MMRRSNERIVKEFESELDGLKQDLSKSLRIIVTTKRNSDQVTLDQLLDLQRDGVRYFNRAEEFASRSKLLEIHVVGGWATAFAETCHVVLSSLVKYTETLNDYKAELGHEFQQPIDGAYASLERMVSEYLPDKMPTLKVDMQRVGLPVRGFDMKAARDRLSSDDKRTLIHCVVGVLFMLPALIVGLLNNHPNSMANVACRGLFALGGCIVAMKISGKLSTQLHINNPHVSGTIKASGAIAIFVILYLLSPSQ